MKQRIIAPEIIEALKEFDSPTVMNAIEKFEVRDRAAGYASMELKCLFPDYKPLVGYAFTATADTTLPGETRPDRLNEMLERIAQAAAAQYLCCEIRGSRSFTILVLRVT